MVIATVDIGGTGIKFAAMSKEGEILIEKQALLVGLARCLIFTASHGMIS